MAENPTRASSEPPEPIAPDEGEGRASRRIAHGTLIRAAGELTAKLASIVFFVILARELGEAGFGDFIFGMALSTVLLSIAGFGTDEMLVREIARDQDRVHTLYANVLALKSLMLLGLLVVLALIVHLGDYSTETQIAVQVIGVGVALEVVLKTPFAVFQAFERMKYIAWSLVIQRGLLAGIGVAVLAGGGGLLEVSIAMPLAAGIAVGLATVWLYARVVRPQMRLDPSSWRAIAKAGIPLGFAILLYTLLLKADVALLSFLTGGDNAEVGQYGAAYRLIEATMFISWAFGGAMMPWLSRHEEGGALTLNRGYELALKALVAMLLPIGVGLVLYAEPLIELIYGSAYADAVLPLRLLGIMTVLFGLNSMGAILMISRDRPGDFARPAAVVIVQNVTFNFILIPPLGATGAAINAVVSGVLLAGFTLHIAARRFGRISLIRVLTSSSLAALALALVALAAGFELTLVGVLASAVAYAGVFAVVDHLLFPGDFVYLVNALRRVGRSRDGDPGATAGAPIPTDLET